MPNKLRGLGKPPLEKGVCHEPLHLVLALTAQVYLGNELPAGRLEKDRERDTVVPLSRQPQNGSQVSRKESSIEALELVKLTGLIELTSGRAEIMVGLMDGPVAVDHSDLVSENIREVPGRIRGRCVQPNSAACKHGTFVAGILCAKRNTAAPAICPDCTLLVRPIFAETTPNNGQLPSATPAELAEAITECVNAGVRVMNLSLALVQSSLKGEHALEEALDYAMKRGVIAVAAVGNQGRVGGSSIISHRWVIPIVACDLRGRPLNISNLGGSVGRRGLSAPGERITSLEAQGKMTFSGGTSVAAPFVSGAIALLWSVFPDATVTEVKSAVMGEAKGQRRTTIVPPLLNAWSAYQILARTRARR